MACVGFYLSVPISGLGDQEDQGQGLVSVRSQLPQSLAAERDIELLKDELDRERKKADRYQTELSAKSEYTQFLLSEVQRYKEIAGLTAVAGSGIVMTLNEGRGTEPKGWGEEMSLIHQEDLLNIINELWHNDAEAIAVGLPGGRKIERITTFSPLRCTGGTIEINDQSMYPPFEILAIGDGELLKSVLEMRGGYLEQLEMYGIQSEITLSDNIIIPSYRGATHWLYARSMESVGDTIEPPSSTEGADQ
jgi:uncharacterized protein YlxW (UPF0749 family)